MIVMGVLYTNQICFRENLCKKIVHSLAKKKLDPFELILPFE